MKTVQQEEKRGPNWFSCPQFDPHRRFSPSFGFAKPASSLLAYSPLVIKFIKTVHIL